MRNGEKWARRTSRRRRIRTHCLCRGRTRTTGSDPTECCAVDFVCICAMSTFCGDGSQRDDGCVFGQTARMYRLQMQCTTIMTVCSSGSKCACPSVSLCHSVGSEACFIPSDLLAAPRPSRSTSLRLHHVRPPARLWPFLLPSHQQRRGQGLDSAGRGATIKEDTGAHPSFIPVTMHSHRERALIRLRMGWLARSARLDNDDSR